jgi:outer membrane protein OmpA-like peptidoglycan-associated protein
MALSAMSAPAEAQDLDFGTLPTLEAGQTPTLLITPKRAVELLRVSCEAGGQTWDWEEPNLPAGKQRSYTWTRDPSVTHAECTVKVRFADGGTDWITLPLDYSYGGGLHISLDRATVDLTARTLTVEVTAPVINADVIAYGAGKIELDRRSIGVEGGPGSVTVPWIGEPEDVVLLDVTLHSANAWAGFTYSPWFLDIPHDDVLFDTNSAAIDTAEEWKLERTLQELQEVIDLYGSMVPVKLYIAGCTDTVGDAASNRDLSRRRAKAIATWLRGHGYGHEIYYYGFGESLPAVRSGDGVDEVQNRRALYLVGANPPPAGSGVPSVGWHAL